MIEISGKVSVFSCLHHCRVQSPHGSTTPDWTAATEQGRIPSSRYLWERVLLLTQQINHRWLVRTEHFAGEDLAHRPDQAALPHRAGNVTVCKNGASDSRRAANRADCAGARDDLVLSLRTSDSHANDIGHFLKQLFDHWRSALTTVKREAWRTGNKPLASPTASANVRDQTTWQH